MNTMTENDMREKHLDDLRRLLVHRSLGAWGMDCLIDTLSQLIPELSKEVKGG